MIDNSEANLKSARENIASIKQNIHARDDVCIREDPLSEVIGRSGAAGQRYAAGQLCIVAGSSMLRISADSDAYILDGTDCGRDWSTSNTHDATQGSQVTLDVGDGEDIVVSASVIETLLSAALFTRWPYKQAEDGAGSHQWLRNYVDGWIEGHA